MGEQILGFVVVPLLGGKALADCLESLAGIPASCVVVCSKMHDTTGLHGLTGVRIVRSDGNVPLRRAIGLKLITSRWIAFIEDTCSISRSWYAAFAEISRQSCFDAAGGPVALSLGLPPRCMALGCLEYGEFASASLSDAIARAKRVAGLNVVYRRAVMPAVDGVSGLIETDINASIEAGGRLAIHPRLGVTYSQADLASAALRSRFAHGRIYGGGLRTGLGAARRAFAALKCGALPLVLSARATQALPSAYREKYAAGCWIAFLAAAWSAGEFVGVLLGRGDSLSRWR